jgi:hypothetical protein
MAATQTRSLDEILADLSEAEKEMLALTIEPPSGDRVVRRAQIEERQKQLALEHEIAIEEAQRTRTVELRERIAQEEAALAASEPKLAEAQEKIAEAKRAEMAAVTALNAILFERETHVRKIERMEGELEYMERNANRTRLREAALAALASIRFADRPTPNRPSYLTTAGKFRLLDHYVDRSVDDRHVEAVLRYLRTLRRGSPEYREIEAAIERRAV